MSIIQYEREPGSFGGIAELPEGGFAVILGASSVGDYAYPPEEIGGGVRRIAAITREPCLLCARDGDKHMVIHRAMDGGDGLGVAECMKHRFVWYRRNP